MDNKITPYASVAAIDSLYNTRNSRDSATSSSASRYNMDKGGTAASGTHKVSKTREQIERQQKFLTDMMLTKAKFRNPMAEDSSQESKAMTDMISQIAQLENVSIQNDSMEQMSRYNKAMFENSMLGNRVLVRGDSLFEAGDGVDTDAAEAHFHLDNPLKDGEKIKVIVYDANGQGLAEEEIDLKGVAQGYNKYSLNINPEALNKLGDKSELRYNIVKTDASGNKAYLKTYNFDSIKAVFPNELHYDESNGGNSAEYSLFLTDSGRKVRLDQITAISSANNAAGNQLQSYKNIQSMMNNDSLNSSRGNKPVSVHDLDGFGSGAKGDDIMGGRSVEVMDGRSVDIERLKNLRSPLDHTGSEAMEDSILKGLDVKA